MSECRLDSCAWLTFAVLVAILCGLCGCERRTLYPYVDTPYIKQQQEHSEAALRRDLHSMYEDDRSIALRVMAHRARAAGADGHEQEQRRLVRLILSHYEREQSPQIRSRIVGVCLPQADWRDEEVYAFLRKCILEGDQRTDACHALAALAGRAARSWLVPLLEHPEAQVRYQAGLALTQLEDPQASQAVVELVEGMAPPRWPLVVGGAPLVQCRGSLAERIRAVRAPESAEDTE